MNESGLKKIQTKLLLSYMIASAVLLLIVLFAVGILLYQNVIRDTKTGLRASLDRYLEQISQEMWVDDTYLGKEELQNQYVIYVLDHDTPILFQGTYLGQAQRQALWDKLLDNEITYTQSTTITLSNDQHDRISKTFFAYQHSTADGAIKCYVCKDLSAVYRTVLLYILILLIGFIIGCLILYVISQMLSRRAMQPIKNNLQEQNAFFHAASHELKSPIAVITANNSASIVDPRNLEKYRNVIGKECERMTTLVQDLLLVASSSTNSFSINLSKKQPDTILIQCYEKMEPLVRNAGMCLNIEIADIDYGEILVDEDRLMQVLQILISNAIAYGKSEKGILLQLLKNKKNVIFAVRDYGAGISAEDAAHIFERFYRSSKDRSDKTHFGLGLSIARQLIESMNGKLTLAKCNSGALFEISFHMQS